MFIRIKWSTVYYDWAELAMYVRFPGNEELIKKQAF